MSYNSPSSPLITLSLPQPLSPLIYHCLYDPLTPPKTTKPLLPPSLASTTTTCLIVWTCISTWMLTTDTNTYPLTLPHLPIIFEPTRRCSLPPKENTLWKLYTAIINTPLSIIATATTTHFWHYNYHHLGELALSHHMITTSVLFLIYGWENCAH